MDAVDILITLCPCIYIYNYSNSKILDNYMKFKLSKVLYFIIIIINNEVIQLIVIKYITILL